MHKLSYGQRRSAFTLIELLVVIAIIAILAAILFPVFAQAKLAAKKTAGLSQMKQIGMAAQLYQGDYDDGLPTWDSYYVLPSPTSWLPEYQRQWDALLQPYVKGGGNFTNATTRAGSEWGGMWRSPGAEYASKGNRSVGINQGLIYNYMTKPDGTANTSITTGGFYRWPTASIIDTPAETVFAGDSGHYGRMEPPNVGNAFVEMWETKIAIPLWARPWRYGGDSANYVFCDGHAKSEKGDKMYPNPGHNRTAASFTAAERVAGICAAAKYFIPSSAEKDYFRSKAASACPN